MYVNIDYSHGNYAVFLSQSSTTITSAQPMMMNLLPAKIHFAWLQCPQSKKIFT